MQPYWTPMTSVWTNLVTGLLRLGVLVDQRTGDVLVGELVAGALDLGQVDGLVGPVLAGTPIQGHTEAGIEVGQRVGGILHPLPRHVEPQALDDVPEDRGADVAALRPGRVVDLRVVLLDQRLVRPEARRVLVVRHPVGGGDGALAIRTGEVRRHLEEDSRRAGEGVL